ncbi:MAG TPA: endolytic transglycosylase MltG [Clostridiales bacterium]|nr:endolytic transglycosylase MltG [Clostridiales bacterium]
MVFCGKQPSERVTGKGFTLIARKITRTLAAVACLFFLIVCTAAGFYFGLTYVLFQDARFRKLEEQYDVGSQNGSTPAAAGQEAPGMVELIVPRAADTRQIAELLRQKEVISNTFAFILLSKFNGFDGSYLAGTHFVTPQMSYDEIMFVLSRKPQTVRVTFPEGLTYSEVKKRLRAAGVNFDEQVLDSLVGNPQNFLDYDFVTRIPKNARREWLLQGYLFPDTYEFDVNADEETMIRTFLNHAENKLLAEYEARAALLGMNLDQVITLASIIQNECSRTEEMRTVSGVFYNKLNQDNGFLRSCATINYLRKEAGQQTALWLADEQINEFDSPYNTYRYQGLPPGPICSPGEDAIRAALWPEKHSYLYFCATGDGSNVFSRTLAEQENNIRKYHVAEGN